MKSPGVSLSTITLHIKLESHITGNIGNNASINSEPDRVDGIATHRRQLKIVPVTTVSRVNSIVAHKIRKFRE